MAPNSSSNGTGPVADPLPDHLDVLIVGAGLSGIGAACHLTSQCPGKSFAIVEARAAMGGTWDLFRYPGIRSDSDMFTLGYRFQPWQEPEAIADGPAIRNYIEDTARDYNLEPAIHYNHRVERVSWSTPDQRWSVEIALGEGGETRTITCAFLYGCTGYYRYDEGFTPEFEGTERFTGEIIHPQQWPEDLDYSGKRVVVIGSGATAVTLLPAMARDAAQVTMLQRSPSYVVGMPNRDPLAVLLQRLLPPKAAYWLLRWKNALMTQASFQLGRRAPKLARKLAQKGVEWWMPDGYDIDPDFNPRYDFWDQRVCLVPDGDLFKALAAGEAAIVTDEIETFTEAGLKLRSGTELEADIIITATGLNLLALGGIELTVDGGEIDLPETVGYKGMMLCGVPNAALTLGYTNASWTLKADLVAEYICRLLNHMDEHGYTQCTPLAPDPSEPTEPFIDLKAGYVLRSIDQLPRQGVRSPWKLHQNYPRDIVMLRRGPIGDSMEFSAAPTSSPAPAPNDDSRLGAKPASMAG